MNTQVLETIESAAALSIPTERLDILNQLADYCRKQLETSKDLRLHFICTHNSRRSQFSQIWAAAAAEYSDIKLQSFSGGVEVTAFNERAVASLRRQGFQIVGNDSNNPKYEVRYSDNEPLTCFSKLFDDPINPKSGFAAVMTCSDADENCPFIPGTDARIPLRYEDPKAFDDTPQEEEMYDERSLQIASEMLYVFNRVKSSGLI
ncbi:low molecular weight phosphatase family protein [Roseivirga misakiensis]|uniref:Protein-tyrosine-phosphatase n=1 Tax=Roseivirga misakiensis TaxID=1563681 RepID=A0A1E5T009_9BACT|nr:protein-tyrosine-phosphatase [Roseivirga misakiensis]OEK04713.1 protein-tyrosine-phosphatase [Roseivirga misakiensis]